MDDLKFNLNAFVKPTNKEEYLALLDEAVIMAKELNQMWANAFNSMNKS